jgi:hypothetical protein
VASPRVVDETQKRNGVDDRHVMSISIAATAAATATATVAAIIGTIAPLRRRRLIFGVGSGACSKSGDCSADVRTTTFDQL